MCGIVGIISSNNRLKQNIGALLNQMAQKIKHRGPDDEECIELSPYVGFGHVRLSILDVSKNGHQPMFSHNKKYCIVFNGEIYNFKELRTFLEKKYSIKDWNSNSDTEVIIEGFVLEGISFIEKLNGIFSLAIYNVEQDEVFLARDSVGVKPFYIVEQNGTTYFASELKALTDIGLSLSLRLQSVQDQLLFMYVPEPYTMFNECYKLLPGEYRVYKKGQLINKGRLSLERFHTEIKDFSYKEKEAKLDVLLNEAIKRQLISDVPVSLFLSGGLDSSLITAIALNNGANIRDAFTISFSKKDSLKEGVPSDDLTYAKIVAEKYGIKLNVIEAKKNMLEYLPEVVYHLDDALSDPAAINTYLICRGAREEGVKVLLSGQGADELFGGYRKYKAIKMYSRIPKPITLLSKSFMGLLPNDTTGCLNTYIRQGKKFFENAIKSRDNQMVEISMWKSPSVLDSLFIYGTKEVGTVHKEVLNHYMGLDSVLTMMRLDEEVYLPSHNLMYTDKMSMMAGVEARVPFLDYYILDYAHQLSSSMMIKGNTQKYLLKKLAEKYLPNEVVYRSKAGFSSPIRAWFRSRNDLADYYFGSDYIVKQGIFNAEKINSLYSEQVTGKKDNAYFLYALLNFQIWYDIFICKKNI